jgi:transitional endoplasmic reticulum ATPase
LEEAIKHKSPSVSQRDLREYERVRGEFSPKDEGRKSIAIGFH